MAEDELIEKLSSLFELHKSGALTPEEYTLLKTRIINGGGEISQQSPMETKQSSAFSGAEKIIDSPRANNSKSKKYDLSYEKETGATIVGVVLILITLGLSLSGIFFELEISGIFGALSIIMRIAITMWVVNIATRQNRNSLGWGFLAFFFPGIVLIIIGLLNKIRKDEPYLDAEKYADDENSSLKGRYFLESSVINEKIGELDRAIYPFKYKPGFAGINIDTNLTQEQPAFLLHHKGFHIELKTKDKKYHNIVISFYEIDDIIYEKDTFLIVFQLHGGQILKIFYDPEIDFYRLKTLCAKYTQATGKISSAEDS